MIWRDAVDRQLNLKVITKGGIKRSSTKTRIILRKQAGV